ncbi:MAG: AmmeMemoRadiSam system protein A [Victivallales bacterium]|jgi:AmmeMemoRadiSam system protein A
MKTVEPYSPDEKIMMLALARSTIENVLKRINLAVPENLPEKLRETRSCFVTLHTKDGSLRGCIGNIEAFEPLCSNIIHNASHSAFQDPRFQRVKTLDELSDIIIEISVLTPPEKIKSTDDFIIGKHGIILSKDFRSSVFLPQVAPEQGWDKETTLVHLSLKAGLDPYAWKEADAEFKVFEAIVFSEKENA